jgi:hypothetical protein
MEKMMIDLSDTIIANSDQLNAADLIGGKQLTILISKVTKVAKPDQPTVINYHGDNGRPYKPNKGMRRAAAQIWGLDGSIYVGRGMTLYRKDDVTFGKDKVGGIWISHMSHIKDAVTIFIRISKNKVVPHTIYPLILDNPTDADAVKKPYLSKWLSVFAEKVKSCQSIEMLDEEIKENRESIEELRIIYEGKEGKNNYTRLDALLKDRRNQLQVKVEENISAETIIPAAE